MTTKNLNSTSINAASRAAKIVADEVRDRHQKLANLVEGGSSSEELKAKDLEIVAATLRQRSRDKQAEYQEELGRLNSILGSNPEPAREPEKAPEPAPVEPEEAPEMDEEDQEDEVIAQPTVVRRSVFEVREWSGIQWLLAFVWALVALLLFSQWPGWASRNIDGAFWSIVVNLLFFIGHLGIGFFGGGWLGWRLRRNENGDS